jgi:hypothetical protein
MVKERLSIDMKTSMTIVTIDIFTVNIIEL